MIQHQKLSEIIADSVRETIVGGEYMPGERLREDKIALAHHTSRTPVREALRQLEAEGLVILRPRRGAIVAPVTEKDIRDYYELQGLVASYAAKRAVYTLSENDLSRMSRLLSDLENHHAESNVDGMTTAHNQFHETIVKACDNNRISSLVQNMVNQFQRFSVMLITDQERFRQFVDLHREIVEALRSRNASRAEFLVAQYSGQHARAVLEKLGPSQAK